MRTVSSNVEQTEVHQREAGEKTAKKSPTRVRIPKTGLIKTAPEKGWTLNSNRL